MVFRASGRRAHAAPGAHADRHVARGGRAHLHEARALGPVSMDVVPVTLKEIFLESVSAED